MKWVIGCNWIETDNRRHVFVIRYVSHHWRKEIYKKLEVLDNKFRRMGYVPMTEYVLHDVDDMQKEAIIGCHSEKFVVSFGLLQMGSGSRDKFRVMKNLQKCHIGGIWNFGYFEDLIFSFGREECFGAGIVDGSFSTLNYPINMGQRNMLCTTQMLDLNLDLPVQNHLHPEPFMLLGNIADFPHRNVNAVLSASGNGSNLDLNRSPERHDNNIFYATQYNGLHHHHPVANLESGVAAASNFYNPYMIPPSGSRMCSIPLNHGSSYQLAGTDEYERNNHFMDGVRGSCKRKSAEGIPGNYQYVNSSASSSSSSSGTPLNTRLQHREESLESGVPLLDAAAFGQPEYRGHSIVSITDGHQRSVRSRSSAIGLPDSAWAHNHNHHLVQGNYMGQSFHSASHAWVDQQLGSNGGEGGTSTLNYAPALPYSQESNVSGGAIEIGSMMVGVGQGYQETEVAILELPGFHEVENSIDHHRDMRLDIDDMSYEELLALEERIGNADSGLSEETVLRRLKTRTHNPSGTQFNSLDPACMVLETDTCIICQVEFEKKEKIGTLDCGHEYHADCITKWLLVKNVCPICKTTALVPESKDR
ncbi:hypothetical protein HHK36_001797 [Tetracentron sinense]|uniref:RING-type E3 ubiquitin transferase n=1 Tax=Tetracentron sinense TaxID=13715 RepID=A0A834ZTF4_TETSI|nr:hypothetical protein HHK36_001797 [Tetracentron sinense]